MTSSFLLDTPSSQSSSEKKLDLNLALNMDLEFDFSMCHGYYCCCLY